jgi:RNA polymerase sigma-70 factor (ECF subfamily)
MDLGLESRADRSELAVESQLPLQDPERMGALLADLEPRLSAVALGFTRDPDAARDVVQNAFEKVLRHGAKFRGQSRVSTWVHRIVTNEALMWLRSQRRRRAIGGESDGADLEHLVDSRPTPLERLAAAEQVQRLCDGMTELSRDERDVVRSCAIDGLSYAEYGLSRGLHIGAVKSRAFRARRRLAVLLQEPSPAAEPRFS